MTNTLISLGLYIFAAVTLMMQEIQRIFMRCHFIVCYAAFGT